MADFAELGLEAAEHLIDSHFDDIPDQVFHPRQALHNIRHRDKNKGSKHPILDRVEGRHAQTPQPGDEGRSGGPQNRRESQTNSDVDSDYSDGVYSARGRGAGRTPGPRTDPYYQEAQRRSNGYYAQPTAPPQRDPRYPARNPDPHAVDHDDGPAPSPYTWNSNPNYIYQNQTPRQENHHARVYSPPRIYSPPRRSRSQSHQHRRRSKNRDQQPKQKRRSSSTGPSQGLSDAFSTSDKGLGAGGLGALAGGFVAQEIEKRTGKGDPMLLTLLGAAVGGIGANMLEGRHERRKEREREERERERQRIERRKGR